jgi:hypothetical protein
MLGRKKLKTFRTPLCVLYGPVERPEEKRRGWRERETGGRRRNR